MHSRLLGWLDSWCMIEFLIVFLEGCTLSPLVGSEVFVNFMIIGH